MCRELLTFELNPAPDRVSLKQFRRFENLLGPRAHPIILCEHPPANGALRVDQKFSGARNVMSFDSLPRMDQIVTANGIEVRIGKKCEGVAGLLTKVA